MPARRCLLLLLGCSLAALAATPRPAPPFSIQFEDGRSVPLSAYRGKPLVLEIILTTCSHCQRVARALDGLYRENPKRGLQVVAVAINDNPDLKGFVRDQKIAFPVGSSPREPVQRLIEIGMGRIPMPQVLLIDRSGTIVSQFGGLSPEVAEGHESDLRTAIENLVKSGPAPAKGNPKK